MAKGETKANVENGFTLSTISLLNLKSNVNHKPKIIEIGKIGTKTLKKGIFEVFILNATNINLKVALMLPFSKFWYPLYLNSLN